MTHTYATLEVSAEAYAEIKSKLLAAEYQHAINDEGEIDMHGIALVKESRNIMVAPCPIFERLRKHR